MKKIAVATGTRADWGLLSPLACALRDTPGVELQVIATNMHLQSSYGHTLDEILADGITPAALVPMDPGPDTAADTPGGRVRAMARCLEGMAAALERLQPHLLVILGDRYEMLATASAALMMRIPIVHIAGGEVSEGAIDDSIRHAITKMASLHLTATEPYRRRVIQMGEHPSRVVNTGAIGVWNIAHLPPMPLDELERQLAFTLDDSVLLVTYHPATLDEAHASVRFAALLEALDRHPDKRVLFTYPNNDAGSSPLIDMIAGYAASHPGRVKAVASLGRLRYLTALRHVGAVVGNSSSGIVEVPSAGIPTVDIGSRQRGRTAGPSVIHCGDSAPEIADAIARAFTPAMRAVAARRDNPYHKPDTLSLMLHAILGADPAALSHKQFHDLC